MKTCMYVQHVTCTCATCTCPCAACTCAGTGLDPSVRGPDFCVLGVVLMMLRACGRSAVSRTERLVVCVVCCAVACGISSFVPVSVARPLALTAGKVPARQAVNAASVFEYVLRVGIFGGGVLVWSVVFEKKVERSVTVVTKDRGFLEWSTWNVGASGGVVHARARATPSLYTHTRLLLCCHVHCRVKKRTGSRRARPGCKAHRPKLAHAAACRCLAC